MGRIGDLFYNIRYDLLSRNHLPEWWQQPNYEGWA